LRQIAVVTRISHIRGTLPLCPYWSHIFATL
jgi:hypothetical protein